MFKSTVLALGLSLIASVAFAQQAPAKQEVNSAARDLLPQEIRDRGYIVSVNSGPYPPYELIRNGNEYAGIVVDIGKALGEVLGIEIRHQTVGGTPAKVAGVSSGRYDFAMGPIADTPERRKTLDFIDWTKEYVSFAVLKGNPTNITSLEASCGQRIATMSGGSAEKVLTDFATKCEAEGKPKLTVLSFADQPSGMLAVKSSRADGFFSGQAVLSYYIQESNETLELAGANLPNGFPDIYQGAFVPKDSDLGKALLAAFKVLQANGTYLALMDKWGVKANGVNAIELNLGN